MSNNKLDEGILMDHAASDAFKLLRLDEVMPCGHKKIHWTHGKECGWWTWRTNCTKAGCYCNECERGKP